MKKTPGLIGQKIDATWRQADLVDDARPGEVLSRHARIPHGSAEAYQRPPQSAGIVLIRAHEDIEVTG